MSKTIKDIQKIKEKTLASFGNRIGNDDNKLYIMTCCGTGCTSSGAIKNRVCKDGLLWSLCRGTDFDGLPRKRNVHQRNAGRHQ